MTPDLAVALVVALFGGGGIIALLKLRGENSRIVVDAAQGAVIVQSSVIEDLRQQVAGQGGRIKALEDRTKAAEKRAEDAEKAHRQSELARYDLIRERDLLIRANVEMQDVNSNLELRVAHLESEVARLSKI
jgi:hypothetical protein